MHQDIEEARDMRLEKNVLIPMRDGVELASDVYLPETEDKVPALITYLPYHKDDIIKPSFEDSYKVLTENNYAGVLIDVRGTGNSGGSTAYPFSRQEQQDGYDAVEWIAGQPWCDGNIGMWGLSYGGFTSLIVAGQNPPHLKAIAPVFFGNDWYLDWCYPGGNLNSLGLVGNWGSRMMSMNLMPPLYQDEEGRWADVWDHHLENNHPWLMSFLDHPADGTFWKECSVKTYYDKIRVPTLIIGGWRDIYPDASFQCFMNLKARKKLIQGPWLHEQPDVSKSYPIDYLREIIRWFDCWIKGRDNGVADEAPLSVFIQGSNKWRCEHEWPINRTEVKTYYLAPAGLLSLDVKGEGSDNYDYDPTVGIMAGLWDPALETGLPLDQRRDEDLSLTYTTTALEKDLEITGALRARLYASSTAEAAAFVVKLCDVAPDGSSSLITTGWLNATHRESHKTPIPLRQGEIYLLEIALWTTSHLFRKGHRIRIVVSSSDFPRIWPTPEPSENTIYRDSGHRSRIEIPTVPQDRSLPVPSFQPPRKSQPHPEITEFDPIWVIEQDIVKGYVAVRSGFKREVTLDDRTGFLFSHMFSASASSRNPEETRVQSSTDIEMDTRAGRIKLEGRTAVTNCHASMKVDISMDGVPYFSRVWKN